MNYTRISNSYLSETVLQNLLSNRSKLVDLQEQISSGKRIQKPSDDVVASISVLSAKNSLEKIDNFLKNISTAESELNITDSTLSSTVDSTIDARSLILQAINDSTGPEQLSIINDQIKQIIDNVKSLANTQVSNKYIFGGFKTGASPFEEPVPLSGLSVNGEIEYTGSPDTNYQRNVEISDGVTIAMNMDGKKIFGEYYASDWDSNPLTLDTLDGEGLLKTLISVANELENTPPDKNILRQNLDSLDSNLSDIQNAQSQVGGVLSRLDLTRNILEDNKINLKQMKSNAEDIDITKAISDLQFQQTALQASLQVSAQIIQPSLLNYL